MKTWKSHILGLLLFATLPIQAATRVDLNGEWQFRIDPSTQGEPGGWARQMPADTETVDVPHTWNIGKYDDYEGTAWYFKTFAVSEDLLRKHVEVHFGATFYRARVWLNGVELGSHEGGYTEYAFDITPHLKRVNFLAVQIDNQPGYETIPGFAMRFRGNSDGANAWYDWWHYGGIVRDVWLTFNEPSLIRRQQIRAKLDGTNAEVEDRVFIENTSSRAAQLKLTLKAYAPGMALPVATAQQPVNLAPGSSDQTLRLRLDSPQLWHFDHPNLYRMEAELADANDQLLDTRNDNFGVRQIEIRDRHLCLNGDRVRLSGITRHEESPWEGLAETRGTIRHDYDDLKNLQVTLTRPVHYPQPPAILDYCDRNGILLIPEIPVWQFSEKQMTNPKVIALAKQMMREMIEQDYNHPCIMGWSACNESATATPGGVAYFRTMRDWIKSLDPDRYVSYADDVVGREAAGATNAAAYADFIMMNAYFGGWHGPAYLLRSVLDKVGKDYPDKMVIISESGLAGVFGANSEDADRRRVQIVQEQMPVYAQYDWIGGVLLWCYQDYKSHRNLWPGETKGVVDHGVVDENRQRRPSYYIWQEMNYPVRVEPVWKCSDQFPYPPLGFNATVSERSVTELPSYPIHDYRLTWEARRDDGRMIAQGEQPLASLQPPVQVTGAWTATDYRTITLTFKIYRPTGFMACERQLSWGNPVSGGQSVGDMKQRTTVPVE